MKTTSGTPIRRPRAARAATDGRLWGLCERSAPQAQLTSRLWGFGPFRVHMRPAWSHSRILGRHPEKLQRSGGGPHMPSSQCSAHHPESAGTSTGSCSQRGAKRPVNYCPWRIYQKKYRLFHDWWGRQMRMIKGLKVISEVEVTIDNWLGHIWEDKLT